MTTSIWQFHVAVKDKFGAVTKYDVPGTLTVLTHISNYFNLNNSILFAKLTGGGSPRLRRQRLPDGGQPGRGALGRRVAGEKILTHTKI